MKLLIQLELSKFKIKRYVLFFMLITIGMCLFTTISLFAIEQDKATNYEEAIKMMNAAIIWKAAPLLRSEKLFRSIPRRKRLL